MQAETTTSKVPWYKKQKGAIFWAIIVTIVIIVLGLTVFISKSAWQLSANEIGDFFAGFAGALSFVWIIATIFLQKEELELQREEVRRLADETALQSALLSSSAKANFETRWNAALEGLVRNHRDGLMRINKQVARSQSVMENVQRQIECEYMRQTGASISLDKTKYAHVYFSNQISDEIVRLTHSIGFPNAQGDKLDSDVRIFTECETSISELKIEEQFRNERINTEEIDALISDAERLDMISYAKHYSIDFDRNIRSNFRVDCVVKCLVITKINNIVQKSPIIPPL